MQARKVVGVSNEFGLNRRAFAVDSPAATIGAATDPVVGPEAGSIGEIKERFVEAMDVLRRLPLPAEYLALKGARSSLPDFMRSPSELAGGEPEDDVRIRPLQREIARLDEVLTWLYWLDDAFTAKCLLARGARVPWKALQKLDPKHRSREAIRCLLNDAYHMILRRSRDKTKNTSCQTWQI